MFGRNKWFVLLTGEAEATPHFSQETKMQNIQNNVIRVYHGVRRPGFDAAEDEAKAKAELALKELSENPDVKKMIANAIESEVKGLKATNLALKGEKEDASGKFKSLSAQLEKLGGEQGMKTLLEMQERLSKDELGKLLAEGKTEEWFERKTTAMRNDFEARLESVTKEGKLYKDSVLDLESTLERNKLENEIRNAAGAAQVIPTAIPDIVWRASSVFTHDKEKGLVLKENDTIVYGKDGKTPKTVLEWLEEQKKVARHWWPASKGGGGEGGEHDDDNTTPGQEKLATMTHEQFKEARKKLGLGKQHQYF